jgi:hypothetical protein
MGMLPLQSAYLVPVVCYIGVALYAWLFAEANADEAKGQWVGGSAAQRANILRKGQEQNLKDSGSILRWIDESDLIENMFALCDNGAVA